MTEARARTGGPGALRVIPGGAAGQGGQAAALPRAVAPRQPGVEELAADMAEIFALSLLRDHPAEALGNPHLQVRIDGGTRFTLHDLLCELRGLPWFDACAAGAEALAPRGVAAARRALCRNAEGQLTLRSLMRSGVAAAGEPLGHSALWAEDHAVPGAPAQGLPGPQAPVSDWLAWCAGHSGAGLRLTGAVPAAPAASATLGALAEALPALPAARPFHNAALAAMARGRLSVAVPGAREGWTGLRLLALMAEAETRARRLARAQEALRGTLARPAVTAARMTLWLSRDEQEAEPADASYRGAAERLAQQAPRLLHWVSRANAARRGLRRPGPALFLPLAGLASLQHGPAQSEAHVLVAGALATLMKAVLGHAGRSRSAIAEAAGPGGEVDRLARDIARARVVGAACLPGEAHAHLRQGQALALALLRAALEADNRSARLVLRDFDGRALVLQANPRHAGRGLALLRADGVPIAWPQDRAPATAHLTRVV